MTALITKRAALEITGYSDQLLTYYRNLGVMDWLPKGRGGIPQPGIWSLRDVVALSAFMHFNRVIAKPQWMADNLEALLTGGMVNSQGFHFAFDPAPIRERIEPLFRAKLAEAQP